MPESDRKQLEQACCADGRFPPGQSLTVKWPVLHEGLSSPSIPETCTSLWAAWLRTRCA
ncbi:MAG: hypothetical protein R2748_01440 [Bryobacterales bacterium]